jgi:dienelactone hydrolase
VAAGKVSRGGLQADGEVAYWSESRPEEGGRQVVVAAAPGQSPVDVSPHGVSVRTRVHEYGGGAFTAVDGVLYYSDADDERLYRYPAGLGKEAGDRSPVAITPPAAPGTTVRFADMRTTPSGRWLIAVEERIEAEATTHRLVAVATEGDLRVLPLVGGSDFVAAPRVSPEGTVLVWTCWDHPAMPWDRSALRAAWLFEDGRSGIALEDACPLAGGEGTSVGQPLWCRDGGLLFADERSGWWLPARLGPDELNAIVAGGSGDPDGQPGLAVRPLVEMEAEFHGPDWALGQSTMAELADGSVVARIRRYGRDQLVHLVPPDDPGGDRTAPWSSRVVDQPCVAISGVAVGTQANAAGVGRGGAEADRQSVWVMGSTPTEAQVVVELPWPFVAALTQESGGRDGHPARSVVHAAGRRHGETDPATVARAEAFVAPGPEVPVPGLYYAPTNPDVVPPEGTPPLVVFCHGGPTGSAEPGYDPVVQFFTSRGLAVAAVDYRGSTGYGRAFRRRLEGRWGEADIDDCVAYAQGLADAGRVDGRRMAIRGTSAGGLTALGALVRSDRFLGAASWYGVTDLEALTRDTHAFESRYCDTLVGPWPEAVARYRQRSPLVHAADIQGAVLLLQGADDPVVPADQAERFAAELRTHGRTCRLVVFPGEAHGFRRADTIEACLEAELDFYRTLFADQPLAT